MRMSSPAGGEASLLLTDRVLIQLRSRPQARTLGQERDCFMWVCVAWWGCMWHGKVVCGMVGLAKRERWCSQTLSRHGGLKSRAQARLVQSKMILN